MGLESKPESKADFERRMRSEARDAGTESTLYSHEAIRSRTAFDAQNAYQAKERNKYRSAFQRLFGINKTSADDIMHEEADRMNALVDESVARQGGAISPQEASDEIAASSEFKSPNLPHAEDIYRGKAEDTSLSGKVQAMKEKIEFKEFLISEDPELEEALEAGNPSPAIEFIQQIKERADRETANAYHDGLRTLIGDQMETFAATKNYDALKNLITRAGLVYLPTGVLRSMPEDVLAHPPIADMMVELDKYSKQAA